MYVCIFSVFDYKSLVTLQKHMYVSQDILSMATIPFACACFVCFAYLRVCVKTGTHSIYVSNEINLSPSVFSLHVFYTYTL